MKLKNFSTSTTTRIDVLVCKISRLKHFKVNAKVALRRVLDELCNTYRQHRFFSYKILFYARCDLFFAIDDGTTTAAVTAVIHHGSDDDEDDEQNKESGRHCDY